MASYRGHLKAGAVTAVGLICFSNQFHLNTLALQSVVASATLLGSLLPDLDHPKSILGRRVPFISKPIHKLFGHRSITHSLFLLIPLVLFLEYNEYYALGLGLGAGMLSHILLDFLCPGSGVAFLYPLYTHRINFNMRFYRFKTLKRFFKISFRRINKLLKPLRKYKKRKKY